MIDFFFHFYTFHIDVQLPTNPHLRPLNPDADTNNADDGNDVKKSKSQADVYDTVSGKTTLSKCH